MRTFLSILLISVASILAAQNASEIVKWDQETLDLGEVVKGNKVNNVYTFTNISSAPVEIDVVSTCECTEAKWTIGEIAPGEKGEIKFVFDSAKKDVEEQIDVDVYFMNRDAEGNPYSSFLNYNFSFKK